MPEISRFFGIIIRMYFDDHNPPHFVRFMGIMKFRWELIQLQCCMADYYAGLCRWCLNGQHCINKNF